MDKSKANRKRLDLYDKIAPILNNLLCFYNWIGDWKVISPKDVIDSKRLLDKKVNIYRPILGEEFYKQYQEFIGMLFEPFAGGVNHDAKICSEIKRSLGDERSNARYEWRPEWDEYVTNDKNKILSVEKVWNKYDSLMKTFRDSLGVFHDPVR